MIRTIVDYAIMDNPHLPGSRNSRLWRSLILPLMPIMLGVGFYFISDKFPYTYPDGVNTYTAKFVFCLAAAALSSVVFKVVKELLLANINQPNFNTYPPYINISQSPYSMPNPVLPPPYNPNTPQIINNGHGIDSTNNSS